MRGFVSIPQWFDWYRYIKTNRARILFKFQSHNGSIGTRAFLTSLRSFNLFQSHNGSIGTAFRGSLGVNKICVSIPQWFDWYWQVEENWYKANPNLFQSHNGSIGTLYVFILYRLEEIMSVSIPQWFDWYRPNVRIRRDCRNMFQSHNGSIGTISSMHRTSKTRQFQSHNGSIGTRTGRIGPVSSGKVSIPQWFDWYQGIGKSTFLRILFQSHNGSIGTSSDHHITCAGQCFNPTMVRLVLHPEGEVETFPMSFNPTMFRLVHQWEDTQILAAYQFQSHNGSIGTCAVQAQSSNSR